MFLRIDVACKMTFFCGVIRNAPSVRIVPLKASRTTEVKVNVLSFISIKPDACLPKIFRNQDYQQKY